MTTGAEATRPVISASASGRTTGHSSWTHARRRRWRATVRPRHRAPRAQPGRGRRRARAPRSGERLARRRAAVEAIAAWSFGIVRSWASTSPEPPGRRDPARRCTPVGQLRAAVLVGEAHPVDVEARARRRARSGSFAPSRPRAVRAACVVAVRAVCRVVRRAARRGWRCTGCGLRAPPGPGRRPRRRAERRRRRAATACVVVAQAGEGLKAHGHIGVPCPP